MLTRFSIAKFTEGVHEQEINPYTGFISNNKKSGHLFK